VFFVVFVHFYLLHSATNKNVQNKKYNKKTGFPDASALPKCILVTQQVKT